MALNDELLTLNQKIKYYTFETFKDIPSEPGVYVWFYPLRIKDRNIDLFIDEVNYVFNFNINENGEYCPKAEVNLGWKNYSIETKYRQVAKSASFIKSWGKLFIDAAKTGDKKDLEELKKVIFISSVFMPPLYIGKATDLFTRCQQHIVGSSKENNTFNKRYNDYAKRKNLSCKDVEGLIFACISTKTFGLTGEKYENLIERILMNLIKPIYSIK